VHVDRDEERERSECKRNLQICPVYVALSLGCCLADRFEGKSFRGQPGKERCGETGERFHVILRRMDRSISLGI
jgi:hypothetical protein